jgi:hypothetical protein
MECAGQAALWRLTVSCLDLITWMPLRRLLGCPCDIAAPGRRGPTRRQAAALQGVEGHKKRRVTSIVITDLQFVSFEAVDSLHRGWGRSALKPCGRTPWILVRNSDQPMLHCILVNIT